MEPDQLPTDAELDESVASLLKDLPQPLQDFLTGPQRNEVVMSITKKYQLHVDQSGVFQKALIFLLLGISDPDEFGSMLFDAGVTEEAITGIANDVNELVFIPLRKLEQQAPPIPVIRQESSRPQAPIMPPVAVQPPPPPPPAQPTPPEPMKVINVLPPMPTPVVPTPPAPAVQPPVQRIAPQPPVNLPGAPIEASVTKPYIPPMSQPVIPVPPPAQPKITAPPPEPRTYGVDPYREIPE